MGGTLCSTELLRRAKEQMRLDRIAVIYGQTESAPMIATGETNWVMPNTEMKIVEPTTSETVPLGVPGELCIRGQSIMLGYDGEPEAAPQTIDSEGWLHTGDLAALQPGGQIQILGRRKGTVPSKPPARKELVAAATAATASR
jgi:fatty-acyl-CoA synthase